MPRRYARILLTAITCTVLVGVAGCEQRRVRSAIDAETEAAALPALRGVKSQQGLARVVRSARLEAVSRAALARITDQQQLMALARNAVIDDKLRVEALGKITDPTALVELACEDSSLAPLAARKLKDRVQLMKVLRESRSWDAVEAAIQSISDAVTLGKLIMDETVREPARFDAIERLLDPELRDAASQAGEHDASMRPLMTLVRAFEPVPASRRPDLAWAIVPAVRYLGDPLVRRDAGDIVSIVVTWKPLRRKYVMSGGSAWGVDGEVFSCAITLHGPDLILSYTWETVFPYSLSFTTIAGKHFVGAGVNPADLFKKHPEVFARTLQKLRLPKWP